MVKKSIGGPLMTKGRASRASRKATTASRALMSVSCTSGQPVVAARGDLAAQGAVGEEAGPLAQHRGALREPCLDRAAGDVRGEDDVGQPEKGAGRRQRLLVEDVEPGTQPPGDELVGERRLVDDGGAGGV